MDAQLVERIKREIEFESTRSAPPAGFPDLPDIPAGRYIDPAFFELEQKHITRVLQEEFGQGEEAAKRLGIPRSTLYQKIKKYGIQPSRN